MNPRLRTVLFIIGIITFIVIAIFAIPRGMSMYFQIRGGQQIEYILRFEEGIDELVCELLPSANREDLGEVESAIFNLNRAISLDRNNSQAYYYLGKAHCLLGELERAKENYLQYTQLRPENPLGFIGLGFVFEKVGNEPSATNAWKSAGVSINDFHSRGVEEFKEARYYDAALWFERADLLDGNPPESRQFIKSIANILSGNDFAEIQELNTVIVQDLADDLEINGSTFQSMLEFQLGENIGDSATSSMNIGYLAFDGSAIVVINVLEDATYRVTVKAQNSPPAPIQLQLEIDFHPMAIFELTKGDGSWEELSTDISLKRGIHILGINFLNDAVINGIDRNASIEWVELNR